MVGKYRVGRIILTVVVVNALFIGTALAFQRSYPSENNVVHQNETQINRTNNSWSRGGNQQGATNHRKSDTTKTIKKGTWSRGGIHRDAAGKERSLVNKYDQKE